MATAKQLPSGSWFIRIYDKELKKQICFTSKMEGKAGRNEVELMAREYLLGRKQKAKTGKTVGECIDEYIDLKENVLSPTTIAEYRRCGSSELSEIRDKFVKDLTPNDVQLLVNKLAITRKAKTIRNAHGLLSAVLNVYAPDLRLRTTLPKVQKKIKQFPDVKDVLYAILDTDIELPCLLAIWCSLRMSEVRGAKKSDIINGVLTIHRTKLTIKGEDVETEKTKTYESTRQIKLPFYILDLIKKLPQNQEYLTDLSANSIFVKFQNILKKNNLMHMSFHDLRHMNASIMLALGIPDKYAMERGGWSTTSVLKSVYQHTFSAEREAADKKIDDYFNNLLDTKIVTNTD